MSAVATLVIAACALVVTGMVIRREFFSPPAPVQRTADFMVSQPDWTEYMDGGHRIGPADAAVTLVTFSDYQCPYCRVMEERLQQARNDYPEKFAYVVRHWPLTQIHPFALEAAIASECAAEQHRFESMHRTIFDHMDSLGVVTWVTLASRAVVPDTAEFRVCMTTDAPRRNVTLDAETASKVGARGTPIVMIGGVRFAGAISPQLLDSVIVASLAKEQP